ncbi:hypothetical protein AX15_007669 [Amanita polypyramis BW_CC]|nr:hypothetical protein AX15_007669 [Amanita polypyramis BW_CC]
MGMVGMGDGCCVLATCECTDADWLATMDLTPIRAHYLKKSLVLLQVHRELALLTSTDPPFNVPHPNAALVGSSTSSISTLAYLGPPFAPPPKQAPFLDLPFLRFIFRQFFLSFPFLASAPSDFYSAKLQPFVSSVLARGLGSEDGLDHLLEDKTDQQDGLRQQHRLVGKLERNLALFIGTAIKIVEPEQVVRLSQSDLDRLEKLTKKRARNRKDEIFEVNIVCVRTVVDRGRMRSRMHEEFIVRTRRTGYRDIFVSRRYGDFRTLAKELEKAHPDEQIRQPPAKDKTLVNAPSMLSPLSPALSSTSQASDDTPSDGAAPGSPDTTSYRATDHGSSRLAREKNRLTLRAYLRALMSSSIIASSPVLRSFLLSGSTTLSEAEQEDARRREEADRLRGDGRKKFAKEITTRVDGLRDAIRSVKGDIMGKDGLSRVFAIIKETPDINDLPDNYKSVIEWARISLASTVFHHYVASDDSSETFASLKRIHSLMPYFMLKTTLKISNPIGMIRSILDLFLAQPFGGRSLLQRMFTTSLTEEVNALQEQLEAVKDKVDDPMMCAKVRQFVYASRDVQELFKVDAASDNMHILTAVLRSAEEPVLSRPQMNRLARAHRAHAAYVKHRISLQDSDDDDGPQDDDAWLIEDLKVLAHLYSRLKDREQLIELMFEGFTADLLKDIITIFYSPLAQVYKAASIADSIGDMQNFVNDLIRTVEQVEELSHEGPQRTVQVFIDLVQRHEQSFYYFVHKVHAKGEGLFDSLMHWIELFISVLREGLGEPISLDFLLPHTGEERQEIMEEVDKVALYHYKLKVLHEDKLRRRFGRAQGQNETDAEDEATEALVNDAVGEISLGELVRADADDLAAEESDSEGNSSEYETYSSGEDTGSSEEEEPEVSLTEAHASIQHSPRNPRAQPVIRVQTAVVNSTRAKPQPSGVRKRSLSLKSMRSTGSPCDTRHPHEIPPPVPPFPESGNSLVHPATDTAPTRRPSESSRRSPSEVISLQSRPSAVDLSGAAPSRPSRHPSSPSDHNLAKAKKKKREPLKTPELVHIPKLLPVFVEMIRGHLRVR